MDSSTIAAIAGVGGSIVGSILTWLGTRRESVEDRTSDLLNRYDKDRQEARDALASIAHELEEVREEYHKLQNEASLDRLRVGNLTRQVNEFIARELTDKAEIDRLNAKVSKLTAENATLRKRVDELEKRRDAE